MEVRPFSILSSQKEILVIEFLANEYHALHCANAIIISFVLTKANSIIKKLSNIQSNTPQEKEELEKNKQKIEKFKKGLVFPPPTHNNTYILHTAKSLYYNKFFAKESLNIFTFSNLLFLLEEYTNLN